MDETKEQLRAVVSGSFKFKPEIDLAIEELRDLGVDVLAPETGMVFVPSNRIFIRFPDETFRPLPSERHMTPGEIEGNFLRCIKQANLLYVVCPEGYVGFMVSLEIGFAIANGVDVISSEPINTNLDLDPMWKERISRIPVMSISEALEFINRGEF